MLEKDFVFMPICNPQGYPQKLWIDVTRAKPRCHFLSWTVNQSMTCTVPNPLGKTFFARQRAAVELRCVTC